MKRSFFRRGLWIGVYCTTLAGCQSDHGPVARKTKPEDPTAWTGSEISKDEPAAAQGLPKTSRMQGGWSSEARDIENSLGVGR